MAQTPPDGCMELLERRRRLALRGMLAALAVTVLAPPLSLWIGDAVPGSETGETIGGALLLAGIVAFCLVIAIPGLWQGFMRRRMLQAVTEGLADIRHIDGEQRVASEVALASPAFRLDAFRASGLVEPFAAAHIDHVLAGVSGEVPFALAELRLLDEKGGRVFKGVLASFRLARPRPGLTIVARDRGLLGNLLARAGSAIERVTLEDPGFERIFETYGTDQVEARVILTTTMLERLKALDDLAHAGGFTCAFRGPWLLVAFAGMSWRCPAWRMLWPVTAWLDRYRARLRELVGLPVAVVATLALVPPSRGAAAEDEASFAAGGVPLQAEEAFSAGPFRLLRAIGMPVMMIASGLLFGGLAACFGWYGLTQGFIPELWRYGWLMVALGLAYGAFAVATGLIGIARAGWGWNAPLRGLTRARQP